MSGFWSEALLNVQAKLDEKTEALKGNLSTLKETVSTKLEAAQERIAADIESLKEEHARFVAADDEESDEDGVCFRGAGGEAASGGPRARRYYTGQGNRLPWECGGDDPALCGELRGVVLDLSLSEDAFTTPPPDDVGYAFPLTKRTELILRLLDLDPKLKRMHAKLAHRVKEDVYWRNYFFKCAELRAARGVDEGAVQGRKRVIQRRFNVGVFETISKRKASTL